MKPLTFVVLLIVAYCFTACKPDDPVLCDSPDNCFLTPDPGPCEAYIPKYFYNQQTGQCEEFIWGGCDGVVPFDTIEDCQACVNCP